MFSLFLRPISPRDVQLYALRDEIEHSKRFSLPQGYAVVKLCCGYRRRIIAAELLFVKIAVDRIKQHLLCFCDSYSRHLRSSNVEASSAAYLFGYELNI